MVGDWREARTEPDEIGPVPDRRATVVIVDNDRSLCDLLRNRLDAEPGLACAGIAVCEREARRLVAAEKPAVILLDVSMGPGVNAFALGAEFVDLSPHSQLLIWTKWTDPTPGEPEQLRRMRTASLAGATDWVSKGAGIDTLLERIRAAVGRGPRTQDSPLAIRIVDLGGSNPVPGHDPLSDLTRAERRCARIVAREAELGKKIDAIGLDNGISPAALKTHLKNIYAKWDVHSLPAFVARARELGLI